MDSRKKYTVKLNNIDKVEQLLQETYDIACQSYTQLQNELNKISNATKVVDLDIDGKEKYSKIIKSYVDLQQSSIRQKYDIAKLMSDIIKHDGNVKKALDENNALPMTLDINKLREIAKNASATDDGSVEEYSIK